MKLKVLQSRKAEVNKLTEVIVIKPIADGGCKKQRMDTTGMQLSRSRWSINGNFYPVLKNTGTENEPFERPGGYGLTAYTLYDANNPHDLHSCWKKKRTMLQKIAIGILAILAVALFLILFMMSKGNGAA